MILGSFDVLPVLEGLPLECDVVLARQLADFLKHFAFNVLRNFLGFLERIHGSTIQSSPVLDVLPQVNHSPLGSAMRLTIRALG